MIIQCLQRCRASRLKQSNTFIVLWLHQMCRKRSTFCLTWSTLLLLCTEEKKYWFAWFQTEWRCEEVIMGSKHPNAYLFNEINMQAARAWIALSTSLESASRSLSSLHIVCWYVFRVGCAVFLGALLQWLPGGLKGPLGPCLAIMSAFTSTFVSASIAWVFTSTASLSYYRPIKAIVSPLFVIGEILSNVSYLSTNPALLFLCPFVERKSTGRIFLQVFWELCLENCNTMSKTVPLCSRWKINKVSFAMVLSERRFAASLIALPRVA